MIATRSGATPEIVIDGDNGFLVEADQVGRSPPRCGVLTMKIGARDGAPRACDGARTLHLARSRTRYLDAYSAVVTDDLKAPRRGGLIRLGAAGQTMRAGPSSGAGAWLSFPNSIDRSR